MHVANALSAAVDALAAAGCETPELDAQVLIADALGVDLDAIDLVSADSSACCAASSIS